MLDFARTLSGSAVRRVFLASGEPLMWRPILDLFKILKRGGLDFPTTAAVTCDALGQTQARFAE